VAENGLMDKTAQMMEAGRQMMDKTPQLMERFCSTIKDLAQIIPKIHQFRALPPPTFGRCPTGQKNKTPPRPMPS